MRKTGIVVGTLMSLVLVLPASGKTYKNTYSVPCGQVWDAVKSTLGNAENYAQVKIDDARMTADYQPKHSVHVDITGTVLQRMNHVTLISKGTGCAMNVVSNWSGWGHEDQGDFKKRVDESLAKPKAASAPQPAKPEAEAK